MPSVEERLAAVEARNVRVEADKAWETSWVRRGLIMAVTYVCAAILLGVIGAEGIFKGALVPVMGYLLSTLSLPAARAYWMKQRSVKEGM
jgi:hypothetical protein